jgi:membrane fusion protein (multidrug efflux system)
MAKRMILMLVLAAMAIGALGFVKYQQITAAIAQGAAFQPPPEAVTTIVAGEERWPEILTAIGNIAAVQGVDVAADLAGIVERINFESGQAVNEGDVLVQLDVRQEQAQLAAAEAARDLARVNFDRLEGLVNERAIARADYDRAAAEQKQTEARVGEIRATIARKTIRAPFTGILGIRQVNLGQYLSSGDPIVPLQALDPIYANFDVPQQYAGRLPVGRTVRVIVEDLNRAEFAGRVTAVNAVVDEATRNIRIQATLSNSDGRLRPGMFVGTEISLGASRSVVTLPASAISYAPYGNSVYVVSDLEGPNGQTYRGVSQRFITLGNGRGDRVSILSGLKSGEEVVTSGVFKLRNGAAVLVNNEVQPSNELNPKPEDN